MATASTAPPNLAQQILDLRERSQRAQRTRAEADAVLGLSQQQLAQIDEELRKLGINPENCEQELATLEAQLQETVVQLDAAVATEQSGCDAILVAARQAQLAR